MPDLSSGRRTAATALLDAMGDPGKVVDRGTILPLGTYEDGSTGLAWPSVLYDPVKSVGRLWDNAPAAADPSASPEVMSQTGEDLFNIGGAVGLGSFAAPKPSNSLGVFGGRIGAGNLAKKGIHGPQQALDMAERMKAEGRTPLEIYQATSQHLEGTPYAGIHWGADGKPRFEISDMPNEIYPADYGPTIEDGGLQLKMGEPKQTFFGGKSYWDVGQTGISGPHVLHSDFANAYPEMSGMSVNIQSSNKIKESGAGMTRSGNIRAFSPNVKSTATQDYDAANTDWLRSALAHELDHKAASIEGFSPGGNAAEMRSHPYYTGEKNMVESLGGPPEEASLYELLAGETQARNTQDRLHMSATDRRATPPWLTQENPYHAQIEPPEGFLQRWLNPWLPAGSKFGTKAADERSQRLFDIKDETPTPSILGREKSQRTQGRSQYDFQKEASTEWPNFPGQKNLGGMYGEPKSVVMIDGRPATIDDFTSEWMKIGGLEDMAMSNGSLPDYLKLHAELWGTNANPDYISGMTELSGLVKAGRLHIVPYDYYQSWAADNVSFGSKALPSTNLYSNDSRASLPYLTGQALDNRAASALLDEGPKGFTAYHGSPHDFDKFDMGKIGTGEGAQAYGHGLYFAENEGVAKSYQEGLSGGSFALDQLSVRDSSLPWLSQYMARESNLLDVKKRIESGINSRIERYNSLSNYRDKTGVVKVLLKEIAEEIDSEKKRLSELSEYIEKHGAEGTGWKTHGKLYQVRINADPEDFLDWDKPLSQQSERVKGAIKNVRNKPRGSLHSRISEAESTSANSGGDIKADSFIGRDMYDSFARSSVNGDWGDPGEFARQLASRELREAGIPGIRYLDQRSRGAGDGSRNYVLFRDDIIDIVKKYGVAYAAMMYGEDAVTSAMGTGAAASDGQTDY